MAGNEMTGCITDRDSLLPNTLHNTLHMLHTAHASPRNHFESSHKDFQDL